jgi:hypothetical protein
MALQLMMLFPPKQWENLSQSRPPVKKILKSKDNSDNEWTQVRLQQNPFLKTEKRKREPIPIPIVETGGTKPSFATKLKCKRINGSVPLFETESLVSESETGSLPMHSKYINNASKRKVAHHSNVLCIKTLLTVLLKYGGQFLNVTINTFL